MLLPPPESAAPPFAIAWNSPWPSACAGNTSTPPDALSRWGVTTNAGNAFNGAAVTTLWIDENRLFTGSSDGATRQFVLQDVDGDGTPDIDVLPDGRVRGVSELAALTPRSFMPNF